MLCRFSIRVRFGELPQLSYRQTGLLVGDELPERRFA
jgi:hypothetical protein